MEVKRVAQYRSAAYPDKEAVLQDGSLLEAVPLRWKGNAIACAALVFSVSLLSSCSIKSSTPANASSALGLPSATPSSKPVAPESQSGVPLFQHGGGRGSIACIVVNPPVFLSESEALDVIREVAEQNGITFGAGVTVKGIVIPVITYKKDSMDYVVTYRDSSLQTDGFDSNTGVAFEFVSTEDVDAWKTNQPYMPTSDYPIITLAGSLVDSINKPEAGPVVAVFYDPVTHPKEPGDSLSDMMTEEEREALLEQSREDLRQQVLDFIAWLKAEGII